MFDFRIDDQCHEKQVLVNSELHCIFQTLVVSKKKDNMILFQGLKFGTWNQKNFKTLFIRQGPTYSQKPRGPQMPQYSK